MVTVAKRALIVGINHYAHAPSLKGCVADAEQVASLLSRHENGEPNYDCKVLLAADQATAITRACLRAELRNLFSNFTGEVLLYFSGHGAITSTGGYLATSDAEEDDFGIPMEELMRFANLSTARDVLLILDCCHSGELANVPSAGTNPLAEMREGVTIIAASGAAEVALEQGGHGVFTSAVVDAFSGGGADHMGWVTAPSIYAYVERRFNAWEQGPVYKTHASQLTVVRKCAPLIDSADLRKLTTYFPTSAARYRLDPEFEPEDENGYVTGAPNVDKVAIAHLFKRYRDAGLLKPVLAGEQLYWTARRGNEVELTPRGKEYWGLVYRGRV